MNICSWLAAIEKHTFKKDCNDPVNFKPKFIDVRVDWDAKFDRFLERKNKSIKQMKTLFAVDDSSSVFNQEVYFNKIMQLFCNNYFSERGDKFYIWNDEYKELDFNEVESFIKNMKGYGGTCSSLIAEIANIEKDNNIEHLIIITDGDVQNDEIDKSDLRFKEYDLHFSFVSTFIIKTGEQFLNESAGCPYSRNCSGFTYIVDEQGNQREQASLLKEDIEIFDNLDKINTYNEFESKFWNIFRVVRAKCLGKNGDEELKNNFLNFKKKINVPEDNKIDFNDKINQIESMINGGLRQFQSIAC